MTEILFISLSAVLIAMNWVSFRLGKTAGYEQGTRDTRVQIEAAADRFFKKLGPK